MTRLDALLDELDAQVARTARVAAEARAALEEARRAERRVKRAIRREKKRRLRVARAALRSVQEQPPRLRSVDRLLLERERDADAVIRALRAAGLRTLLVELDEEGCTRVVSLDPGVSADTVRAVRRAAEVA